MDGGINPDATLDYVEFHLFPNQNRYEANSKSCNNEDNVASGPLEQLQFLVSPEIKTLSNTKFKILPPENVNDASWFTTATLTRFLQIINLPDIVTIGKEISQLEETRNFQLSLSDKSEADITTSIESKNELLQAVDLRLTDLKKELASAFNQAISSNSSPNDISDIKNFTFHFGTKYLRDSLQSPVDINTTLTEHEDSTASSEDDEPKTERSRGVTRSAISRRSASPMRRIQIGRSGSRRSASLSIKSLNYFPVKEKSTSQIEAACNSSETEEEDSQKPVKNNVLRMSVQDKISLFESKQRDQSLVDIQKTKTSVGANKAVLRRWSSEIGQNAENSVSNSPKTVESDNNIIVENETCVEMFENVLPVSVSVCDTREPERDESFEKNNANFDWSQQKESELNKLVNELMESKPVEYQNVTVDDSKNKSLEEHKGGFYELYKKKREEKLQGEASRKTVEKEASRKTGSTKLIGGNKRLNATNEVKKTQKNATQLINSKTKPSSVKKSTSKPSPLVATRKSWPSTPSPARTQVGPTSTNSTPTNKKPQSASSIARSTTKAENLQPKSKTLKATKQDDNKTIKAMNEKKQPKVTENKRITKNNVITTTVTATATATTATGKPSLYNKVTKKSSVVPLETKPFLRKGSGTGPGVGPVIKTKVVGAKTEENKVVTKINITGQNQVNDEFEPSETSAGLDLEPQVVSRNPSPTKCEPTESSDDGDSSRVKVSEINIPTEEKIEISPTAWVVSEEHQHDEIIPFNESPIKSSSPTNVETPAGYERPRVRHSLSQMLLEDNNEVEIGEWGNAEHPPTMVYQKDAPRGIKRLLKFARKAKADSHFAASWSSPTAVSEGEDDAEESKSQSSSSNVSASMNTTKATRSFFSLSAFRGNKNETKFLHH